VRRVAEIMAYLCCGRVVLRKGIETLKVVQSVPVVYSRCSSCDASRRYWEPVEKETTRDKNGIRTIIVWHALLDDQNK
jgi:hypothetical protein